MIGGEDEAPEEPDISVLNQHQDLTLLNTFQVKPSLEEKY